MLLAEFGSLLRFLYGRNALRPLVYSLSAGSQETFTNYKYRK